MLHIMIHQLMYKKQKMEFFLIKYYFIDFGASFSINIILYFKIF